jgi:predicted metalloprotease with PDZ domain
LNHEVPFDWNGLLKGNLLAVRPTPVSPGLEAAGWTVVYTDEPNQAAIDAESTSQQADLSTSIGLLIDQDGTIVDIVPDSAAGRAGLAPASKLMGVNHRVYSADLLRQAIVNAETSQQPIDLLTLTDGYYAEFPWIITRACARRTLARIAGKPDLLTTILQPRRVE